ncbi:MucBP domain-containing protein [Aerococcus sp. Group 2]|uniref:MucBP domain-containing protein n=1 Tax=Aerococcus sp. Group 2 TaxID=2976811 RepID=UPI0018A77B10|nr:MucBP domain-containing protein [Aerococcus sp. Group 2]
MENFEKRQRFSIRKLSVGVGSVLIATLLFAQSGTVYADEISHTESKLAHVGEGEGPNIASEKNANPATGAESDPADKLSHDSAAKVEEKKNTDQKVQDNVVETGKVETGEFTNTVAAHPAETATNVKDSYPESTYEVGKNDEGSLDTLVDQLKNAKDSRAVLKAQLNEVYSEEDSAAILSRVKIENITDSKSLKEELTKAGLDYANNSSLLNKAPVLAAINNEGKDVSNLLNFTRFDLKHNAWKPDFSKMELKDFNEAQPIRSYMGESGYVDFDVEIPDATKAGDYFIIDYGKNVRPGGIETPIGLTPLISEGVYITDITYDEANNRVFHRFNKEVEKKDKHKVHYQDPFWQKYDRVTDSKKKYPIELTVGGKSFKKELSYDYGNESQGKKVVFGANINVDDSGDKKRITQVWHVNRYGEKVPEGNHSLLWESNTGEDFESIKVYEVTDDRALTDSPNPRPNPAYVKEIKVTPEVTPNGTARVDLGSGVAEGKKYIVVTVANPTKPGPSVDWLSLRNKDDHSRPQDSMGITIGVNNSASSGSGQKRPGMFIENHRYELVDEDGNVLKVEDRVTKFPQKGFRDEQYTTAKEDREGYKFVRAENPKEAPTYSPDGAETKGNYKAGKTQEITYVYQRTVKTKGSFQEHHIYRTVDKNGNVIYEDSKEDGKTTEGKSSDHYTTSKKDKPGYKLVKVEGKNGGKFAKNGAQTKANYVDNTKQEVTYIYERVQEEKGSFQEHHIYRTVDKNGNVLSTDEVTDGETSEGKSSDQYTTSKKDKPGYKLVKVEGKNGGRFDKNGAETKGNYVDNTKQEVTYIYEKVQEEKGTFQEHHIYRTVDKNGNILSTDEVSNGDTSEGKSSDQYTTSKKDKPDYKLVKVEGKNGGRFDKNGAETKGNYVDNTKQEVTYIYEKVQEEKGSFQEHHIYRTVDKNGNVISEDSKEDGKITEGKSDETYTTSKKDKAGYKLVKIEAKNGGKFDKNGAEIKGNYVDNTKQEVTYIYERVQEEKGSFQEHHIYRTVDKNGNILSTDEVSDGETSEGKSSDQYTTSKKDKPGYKLVKVEGRNGGRFDKNGAETKANYVDNTKQEVTYIYERVQEEKGSFQEHHIYRTVDKNGNVLSTDEVTDGETSEGKSDETYTTSKKDKAGYKLVKIEGKNGGKFDKNGAETKANYVDNTKQEVTYIYEKVQEEKGTFQEHHIYRTVDKNGNVISEDYKEDGKTTEGKSDETYTTSKKDKAGYKLVKIEAKNGGKFDKNGAKTKANYVDKTKQEVTYIYERVQEEAPVEKKGSFQEHHIYRTVDKNGNVISEDSKEDGKITEGKSDETYTTSKKDKAGYKLVKVEAKNGGKFDKNGVETKGNYVDNTKQEVTYIYERVQEETPVEKKGSFQEHHIYRTVDKNGKVISEDYKEDGKTTEGKSDETYTTSKKDKPGYKLVKIESKNGGQFDKSSSEIKGNYVNNIKQEVTYIYERVQKDLSQEYPITQTSHKNGKVTLVNKTVKIPDQETPVVKNKEKDAVLLETPKENSKKDKVESPTVGETVEKHSEIHPTAEKVASSLPKTGAIAPSLFSSVFGFALTFAGFRVFKKRKF